MKPFGADLAAAAPLITATLILVAGVIDDLRSRKFHNWLFLTCSAVALIVAVAFGGFGALPWALGGFVAGIAVFLPLVLLKVFGAGDMKLMAAFGIVAGWGSVLTVAMYSVIWGALFGLLQVILQGQLKSTLSNMVSVVTSRGKAPTTLHKIPYSVALLVGWLSDLVLKGVL